MFTNTPIGTRRQKAPRARPRISGADQPAAPLPSFPGVPSYSYGSPNTTLPHMQTLADTNIHITAAINHAARQAAEREKERQHREHEQTFHVQERDRATTPKRKSGGNKATPEQITRRKGSLRSASRPGSAVSELDMADRRVELTTHCLGGSPAHSRYGSREPSGPLHLELDLLNDYAEEQALYDQLIQDDNIDDSRKETDYGDDTRDEDQIIEINGKGRHYQNENDINHIHPPISAKIVNFFGFWIALAGRIFNSIISFARDKIWGFLRDFLIWPIAMLSSTTTRGTIWAIAIAVLTYYLLNSSYISSFPFGGQKKRWTAPDLPPSSAEEIISRIMLMEKEIGRHATLYDDLFSSNNVQSRDLRNTNTEMKQIGDEINSLADDFKRLTSRLSNFETVLKDQETKSASQAPHLEKSLKTMDERISLVQNHLKNAGSSSVKDISTLQNRLHSLRGDLQQIQTEMKQISSGQYIQEQALKVVEKYLPQQLAVKMNPKTRKLDVVPEFWNHLKSLFPTRQEMESRISEGISSISISDSSDIKVPSWGEFLKNNEHAIKQMIQISEEELLRKANDDGMIVSKAVFMDILSDRMAQTQSSFQSILLDLQKRLDEEIANSSNERSNISELTTAAIENLVQSALLKYTSDTVAKTDFALYTAGGRINPFLTSPTWRTRPRKFLEKLVSPVIDLSQHGHPPAIAIDSDNAPGQCWAMPGHFGYLGLRLSQTIYVSDITVDHIHPDIATNIESAPKEMEFWVEVDDLRLRSQIREFTGDEQEPPFGQWGGKYVKLLDFTYDVQKGQVAQTFTIPIAIKRMNIPVRDVIFRVTNNSGLEKYTCLYRVRVHGVAGFDDRNVENDDIQAIGSDQEI
ncbi:Spindle pole body-associated protein sad1 [Neolecta irregularis DAH-3]|uniref:Spindle pole body-associated protein sad1 n=1 Tax=Neolecta irregularis (strain DAH-3) TaxID=1198029 RepID=A0A1U7LPG2_NEOID|nr:Spindle pole body-associated protein sad1 [Neolecta irregularis DAH-3]|eukprot:OLL24411.1 Spindle pole body-associated protein sad1 [Neolecta irregularis DAH-3]